MQNFKDKVVVISGATGGLGRAMAMQLAQKGAKIAALDLDTKLLRSLEVDFARQGLNLFGIACDVTSKEKCKKAIDVAKRKFGKIDIVINNAGISHRSAFRKTDLSVIEKVMAVNFHGSVYLTKFSLEEVISNQGSLVVISSIAGFSPLIARTGYSAAKHAVVGFFSSLRTELYNDNVHVMIAYPAFAKTGIGVNALGGQGKVATKEWHTIGKPLDPEFVAFEIINGLAQKKDNIYIGSLAKKSYWVFKFLPKLFAKKMAQKLRHEMET